GPLDSIETVADELRHQPTGDMSSWFEDQISDLTRKLPAEMLMEGANPIDPDDESVDDWVDQATAELWSRLRGTTVAD
ncbi:MAG: hypothetical protein AAF745_06655, partial [Planctomycetota bacterium]